ncbi:MAG: hypothetical protein AAFR18_16410 [Cyanobacteria bacterium J06627_32]
MAPFDRLKERLTKVEDEGCQVDSSVDETQKEYERRAEEAYERLQEKQKKELEAFLN